jgi:hypothetical protein
MNTIHKFILDNPVIFLNGMTILATTLREEGKPNTIIFINDYQENADSGQLEFDRCPPGFTMQEAIDGLADIMGLITEKPVKKLVGQFNDEVALAAVAVEPITEEMFAEHLLKAEDEARAAALLSGNGRRKREKAK